MAEIKHARGVQLLLRVGDGESPEVFTVYCTINAARSITGEAATNEFNIPDCDDLEAVGWIVSEKVSLSYTVSGAGILNTPDAEIFAEWLHDPLSRNCEIVVDVPAADGGITFAGKFHLTTFELTGDRGAKIEANLALVSDGVITVTAVAVAADAAAASRRRGRVLERAE